MIDLNGLMPARRLRKRTNDWPADEGAQMLVAAIRSLSLIVAATFAPLAIATPADALDCPAAQAQAQAAVIHETPDQIAAFSSMFAEDDIDAQVPKALEAMRKRYPNAQSAELANNLITAYCPTVQNLKSLTDGEKTAGD